MLGWRGSTTGGPVSNDGLEQMDGCISYHSKGPAIEAVDG